MGIIKAVGVITVGCIVYYQFIADSQRSTTSLATARPAVATVSIDKSEETQAKRKVLIQKMIDKGLITKVATSGRVHVTPRFSTLDFDDKQKFIGVIYAYVHDGRDEFAIVQVFDSRTNKNVGVFTQQRGLVLD